MSKKVEKETIEPVAEVVKVTEVIEMTEVIQEVKEPVKPVAEIKELGKKIVDKFYWGFRSLGNVSPYLLGTELKRMWSAIMDMKADIEELKGKK